MSKAAATDRILLAAKQLFAEAGYEYTSTSSIARAAQTSESQIIKHYGSKEGLLEAIFEDGWRNIGEAFGAVEYLPAPTARLQALVGLVLTRLDEDDQLKRLFLLEGRKVRKQGHMILMTRGFRSLVQHIDALLTEMKETGQLRSDLNVEGVRSALIGMMEGLMRDRMLASRSGYSASFSSEDIRKIFLHVLQSFSTSPLMLVKPSKTQGRT